MAASSSEFLQDLAKKPPAHKAAILFGILAVVGFVYWQFFYSDLKTSKQKAERKRNRLQQKRKQLEQQVVQYNSDRCRTALKPAQECARDKLPKAPFAYGDLKDVGQAAARALPARPEWGTFIDILQKKAGSAQVRITSLDTKKEESAGEYIKVPASIEVIGTYHNIMKFFYLLRPAPPDVVDSAASKKANKVKVDRIVNVENLALGPAGNKAAPGTLKATFLASTFYRKAAPPPAAPSGAAPGGAAPATPGKPKPGGPATPAQTGVQRLTHPGAGLPK